MSSPRLSSFLLVVALLAGATEASALSWRQIGLPSSSKIVSDPIRNRLLLFDAENDRLVIREISLDDSSWAQVAPIGPTVYMGSGDNVREAFFDSLGDRAFVLTTRARLIEVKFSDGPRWGVSTRFPLGDNAAFAFDSKRRRVLAYGGKACNAACPNELLEIPIDNLSLLRAIPVSGTPPVGRSEASMVYDSVMDRVVLNEGPGTVEIRRGIWACTLAGTPTWRYLAYAAAASYGEAVFDPVAQRVWLLGDSVARHGLMGISLKEPPDGPATLAVPGPTSRLHASLSYDASAARLLYHGGDFRISSHTPNDIWGFPLRGPGEWSEVAPAITPPPWVAAREGGYAAHDPHEDRTLAVFWDRNAVCAYGWMRADGRWTRGTVSGVPWRLGATLTFDKRRGRMLLFGGSGTSGASADLYALSTTTIPARWIRIATGPGPEPRSGHGAVYDSTGDRLIVIGGTTAANSWTSWELHLGESPPRWSPIPQFPGVASRLMAYDEVRRRVMVPGGDELWWLENGGTWQRKTIGGYTSLTALDYDPARDELMGLSGNTPRTLSPTLGGAWVEFPVTGGPYDDSPQVFDRRRSRWIHLDRKVHELTLPCPLSSTLPTLVLPDGTLDQPYRGPITFGPSFNPVSYRVASGRLPNGLGLGASTGELSGTTEASGWHRFVASATDDSGCVRQREVSLYVRPCTRMAGPVRCLRSDQARVDVFLVRGVVSPITGWSAWVRLPAGTALAEPCIGDSCPSVEPREYYDGCSQSSLRVQQFAGGLLKLEGSMSGGGECGSPEESARLFTLVLRATADQGGGEVELLELKVESPADTRSGSTGMCGPSARVLVDRVLPGAMEDLSARTAPGGSAGTLPVRLEFTPPADAARVRIYRAEASASGGSPPPSYPPGPPWVLTGATLTSPIDRPAGRGKYSYVAYSVDSCDNVSLVSNVAPALNYRLGDFWSGAGACTGDNAVDDLDFLLLRDHYGRRLADSGPDPFACVDIGPTTTGGLDGIPLADGVIDLEDLAIFAMDYDAGARGAGGASGPHRVRLDVPERLPSAGTFDVPLELDAAGDLLAVRLRLDYDESVLALEGVEAGALLWGLTGRPFARAISSRELDLAICGGAMRGVGEAARLTFRVLGAGDAGLRLAAVEGRDVANRQVAVEIASDEILPPASVTFLSPASPNPASGVVSFRIGLAEAGPASLVVFDLQGRRVRDLLRGEQPAGERVVSWDGRSDTGEVQPAGVYVARFEAGGTRVTRRWVFAP